MIGFVALATLVVMIFALGSPVLAVLGVALNLAAVASAWGALTLVFQGSWAEDLLGFTSTGFIGSRMPLMVFAILVGLSTDYQIFVVSRIREAVLRGVPTRQAVLDGITSSASVVTSAAVIMISIFVSFMLIDRIELKQVGLGLTVAVLFDAVVLRILILPAAMTLLGERCWWPTRFARQAAPELFRCGPTTCSLLPAAAMNVLAFTSTRRTRTTASVTTSSGRAGHGTCPSPSSAEPGLPSQPGTAGCH